MNRNRQTRRPQAVLYPSRQVKTVVCPHCWTAQRTERDFCYRCSAPFLYQDERPQEGKAG